MGLDSRNLRVFRIFSCLERREPPADGSTKRFDGKPPVFFRKELEFEETCEKKILCAKAVRARIMVKCCGNLNQTLKEPLFRVRRFEPHLFPMFVRVIKMRGIECFKSFLEQPILFLRIHEFFVVAGRHVATSKAS